MPHLTVIKGVFIPTLNEDLLRVPHRATIEELRPALLEFQRSTDQQWLTSASP
jgi:hypothetical protein